MIKTRDILNSVENQHKESNLHVFFEKYCRFVGVIIDGLHQYERTAVRSHSIAHIRRPLELEKRDWQARIGNIQKPCTRGRQEPSQAQIRES
jgi:hypothetical protein